MKGVKMSKLTSDEFIKKYTEEKKVFPDDDVAIEFMEDISDSLVEKDDSKDEEIKRLQEENSALQEKVEEVTTKYKERFLSPREIPEEKIVREEPVERNFIDIKEI